jgi:Arc/MetJ-type ribon-helix-helix transcriptional regulator
MNIPLKKAQQDWLDAQVAAGRFASLADALAVAVARLQADDGVDDEWTRPPSCQSALR